MDDFRRLFARYRVILTIGVLVGCGVALVFALAQSSSYTATASLSLQDLSQIEGFVGQAPTSSTIPAQLAAAAQRSIETDAVLGQALRSLPYEHTIKTLRDDVTPSIDPGSDLVLVAGTASDAHRAAAIANAVAAVTAAQANARMRATFAANARTLAQKITAIPNIPANKTTRQQDQTNLSRLQTLSIVAQPAQIAQRADVPTSATSRRIVFDVLLGGVLGLILGLGVAFGREALDRSVHSPDDVSRDLALPIVGHVDEELLGGASPFITGADTPAGRNGLARFGIIRRGVELLGGEGGPHTVLVTSPGPDEGKTTVALSLACAFASAGRKTLLLEADLRRPALAQRLGLNGSRGIGDYLRGADGSVTEIVQRIELASSNGTSAQLLECALAGAPTAGSAEALASHRFADALRELAADHDVVIIDGPPLIPVADALEIVPLVDAYVICLRAGRTRLAQLSATRRLLDRLPERPGGAVVTGVAIGRYQLEGYDGYYRETA
jgi:Mrp family chromosome partitioning ATPase